MLFLPTVHVHDGTLAETARFDHVLYVQGAADPSWETSESAPHRDTVARAGGILAEGALVRRRPMAGELPNRGATNGSARQAPPRRPSCTRRPFAVGTVRVQPRGPLCSVALVADAALLARERHEHVVAAACAARAPEAMRQHPAAQVRAKLFDDVPRQRLPRALLGEAQERLQMLRHERVQCRLRRVVARVGALGVGGSHRRRAWTPVDSPPRGGR